MIIGNDHRYLLVGALHPPRIRPCGVGHFVPSEVFPGEAVAAFDAVATPDAAA